MKTEIQPLEDHQVKLIVEFEPSELESAKRRAARDISQRTKIPGFRPGKAPYNVVVRLAGEDYVTEKAIELLAEETYPKVLKEHKIEPYDFGTLQDIPSRDPLKLEYRVPLQAEAMLGDYRAIRIPYAAPAITDADVERMLQELRQRQAIVEPVERPAQAGDVVSIRLSAQRKQVEEGENAMLLPERTQSLTIGDAPTPNEWPFPRFSAHLLGLAVGDSKTVDYTFPEDSAFEALRGKEVTYRFTVEAVKQQHLPALDDEFAQSQGDYETIDALRQAVRAALEKQAKESYDAEYTEKIIERLLEDTVVKYPPQMLEDQIDAMLEDLKSRLAQQHMELETYLKTRQMDMDALRQELRPAAEKRLQRKITLTQIAENESIQVRQDEIVSEANQTINQISSYLQPKDARKILTNDFYNHLFSDITSNLLYTRLVERLHAIAKGEAGNTPTEASAAAGEANPHQPETENASLAEDTPAG